MQNLRKLFEGAYPGINTLFNTLIKPIFSKVQDLTLTSEQELSDTDKKQIKSFKIFAQVKGGFPVTFADVELKDSVALKRSRVNIQNCVRKILNTNSNAIIFFHFTDDKSEWRVSYVNIGENLKNSTNAKRYTYLCGPEHSCRTITERFEELQKISGKIKDSDMIKAFSVEPISNDFFDQYKEIYANLVEYISGKRFIKKGGKFVEEKTKNANPAFSKTFDGDDKLVRDYVKKLMGRLVFLQFLQKKGWLGVKENEAWGSGDKNFLYNLFNKASDNIQKDFLESALEPLFFKTLNVERKKQNDIAPKELCDIYGTPIRIPYLNGGLFEEDEVDKKKVKFKAEHFREIFDFFNQYNFTIDETDSDEKELGVDPEMLGKIFENLLEDNKDKGAFYTPKEIVQYMCSESLIAYLLTDTKINENKIRTFVAQKSCENLDLTQTEKTELETKLKNIKICDPAVGSGAFPMGMLNELYDLRVALNQKENNLLSSQELAQIKKDIVKQNIYGVDIEKGAIDIARLRFWLSIIVDEEKPLPLPNLDYKLMQGNSLLESFEGVDLSRMLEKPADGEFDYTKEQRDKLNDNLSEYFDENNHTNKETKNDIIKSLVFELVCATVGCKENSEKGLELYRKIINGTSDFFLWHTWFNDVFTTKGGFDVVIGNPPYISAPSQIANPFLNKQRETLIKSGKFKSIYQKWDLYVLFIELGMQLNKQNGITAMIVPYPLTNQLYAYKIRKMITEENSLLELVDLNGTKIFESATVSNCIPFIKKSKTENKTWISNIDEKLKISRTFEQTFDNFIQDEKTQVWNVTQEKRQKNKHDDMHVLGDFCYVSKGMVLNADEKEAKGEFKKDDLVSETKDKIHNRKFIEGKDCGKYFVEKIRYLEYDTERVPDKLSRPTFRELYTTPKLMFNRLGNLQVFFDEQGDFTTSDAMFVCLTWKSLSNIENKSISSSIKKFSTLTRSQMEELSKNIDLKYLLAIMNSKYASVLLTNIRGGDYHIYPEHIRNIPIPNATAAEQESIIALVEKILEAKKQDPASNTSALEKQIDTLVYKLYGLSPEEIAIVEG